jgi:hypothetical protein
VVGVVKKQWLNLEVKMLLEQGAKLIDLCG